MKLSKALLGAIVVGITAQATAGCNKKDTPTPQKSPLLTGKKLTAPDNCPACGLG